MAHQLLCLSNLSVPNHLRLPSHLTKPKPSLFKFKISAESHDINNNDNYKLDRRKMVLGLGASNLLLSTESTKAAGLGPLQPPVLEKCHYAQEPIGDGNQLDVECCPGIIQPAYTYTLPQNPPMRTRRSAHEFTGDDLAKYEHAITLMKQISLTDPEDPRGFTQQANVHCAYCNGAYDQATDPANLIQVHGSWLFFPFHRWYMYFFERICGSLIGDPHFALPFWNWDNPVGMTVPPIFLNTNSPLYDAKRNQDHMNGAVVNLGGSSSDDPNVLIKNNAAELHSEMITGSACATQFMGSPFCEGNAPIDGPGRLEFGSHNAVHGWTGEAVAPNEDMGNFASAARDPIFYSHHTNVDRMWTIWQSLDPTAGKSISFTNFTNASFLFYDENKKLAKVKVGDCLDNVAMGYQYEPEDITSWKNYMPSIQSAAGKRSRLSRAATAPKVEKVLPLKLEKAITVVVKKAKKGKAAETLVLENIAIEATKLARFDVFVNDEDEVSDTADKAAFVGSFTHVPRSVKGGKILKTVLTFRLTSLFDRMDVEGDETILVSLVPRRSPGDQAVTIGGIKVVDEDCTPVDCTPTPST